MAEPPGLSAAERRLWRAFPIGAEVTLGTEVPTGPDPDRIVRAEIITQLLLGACETRDGFVPAVRLRGAYVTGRIDVTGGTIEHELRLEHCRLVQAPKFSNCRTRQLRLSDCRMPGFDGGGLLADGYLSLSRSEIEGQVRLPRAHLTGGFRMNGTKVTETDPSRWALFSGGTVIDVGFFAQEAEITGGVRLVGARMGGGVFMQGATLRNPGRLAMDAENMIVDDAAEFSRGFRSEGTMRLRGMRVNGTLSFSRGVLDSCDPDRMALHGSHMQVDELILWPAERIKGTVSLADSRIGVIQDSPEIYPDRVWLHGLVYNSLQDGDVKDRLDWVSRDDKFHLQPYEQLAGWYHATGHDYLARRVQLAKLRARRRGLNPVGKAWNVLLDWTVGYGYRPWLAFAWFGILVAIGTVVFSIDHPRGIKQPAEQPTFHAFVYTLDLLIPIDTFGQQQTFDPTGWSRWVAYTLIAIGWVLATALIAGVTRVLRPN
ncbi:hypothetical protein [Spirillospora sp. NPDC047279]|uniref:hypothetical protein n=1 Tax=Spirillospora sp. NPDC047279 TaxID=3155478 RepID=UPI0033FB5DB2